MTKKRRVGIYGGTFNPPHLGHVGAADAFCHSVPLDELIIMPDFLPPHKELSSAVSADDRLRMCELAFSHIEKANVSDLEIRRGGRSYTSDTLEALAAPDRELYFLCGTDMLLTLSEWYRPERIFELATICYVRRETDLETSLLIDERIDNYKRKFDAKIIKIEPIEVREVSSSEVREALKDDSEVDCIPEKVLKYIREKGFYR